MTEKGGIRVYDEAAATTRLAEELPRWSITDGHLRRVLRVQGWKSALMVAGAIGHLAERAWHHPELRLAWGRVEVRLRTHDPDGITERDFALAHRIEETILWQPRKEEGFDGTPADPRFAYILEERPGD